MFAILGRRGTNMAQVPERGVRDVRDSWGVEALFGGFDKPEQVHSRLVIPPKVRPIRVVTLESPLLNLKFPPSIDAGCAVQLRLRRRAQRRYQPTGTIVGRATIPRAARERPEDGLRSRPGARAVRSGQHRGPSWGRSELRRRRVTVQAGRDAGGARCGIRGVCTAVLRGDVARTRASGREGAGCHVVNRIPIIVPSQVSLFLSSYGQLD